MLAVEVRHLKIAAVVLLALLTAGQLALHHHALTPEGGNTALVCGVCVFVADDAGPSLPPAISLVVISVLTPAAECAAVSATPLALTTRGPPQA
jgi:hypothetical protein